MPSFACIVRLTDGNGIFGRDDGYAPSVPWLQQFAQGERRYDTTKLIESTVDLLDRVSYRS